MVIVVAVGDAVTVNCAVALTAFVPVSLEVRDVTLFV